MVASGFGTLTMFEWSYAFPSTPFPRVLVSVWADRTSSGGFCEVAGDRTKEFCAGGMNSVAYTGLLVGKLDLPGEECSRVALGRDCIDWSRVMTVSFRA